MGAKKPQRRWDTCVWMEELTRFDCFWIDEGAGMFARLCLCASLGGW
jgi:hypothetical protein